MLTKSQVFFSAIFAFITGCCCGLIFILGLKQSEVESKERQIIRLSGELSLADSNIRRQNWRQAQTAEKLDRILFHSFYMSKQEIIDSLYDLRYDKRYLGDE